ncbi:MAG TPA: prephenate dehydrogenase [Actinomycetota bacterium]|nr:prephenate dehydrogenase [Actinomycetota bacterium]
MRRVAIVGTGLIGGSIGAGLRALEPAVEVVGYDEDASAARRARALGAVGDVAPTAARAVETADVVVLAVPLDRMPDAVAAIQGAARATAVITDVGSAKGGIVPQGEAAFGGRFVGGHPMAGSERNGIEASDGALFRDAAWVLTPTDATDPDAYRAAAQLATSLGSHVVALGADVHDSLVARLSHLPQLLASCLVEVAAGTGDRDALLTLAGGGFRDVTRIAASHPDIWMGILRGNRDEVLEAIDRLRSSLETAAGRIREGRWDELRAWMTSSRAARLELFTRPDHSEDPVALALLIPDRPGVLAEVTTEAGRIGANIEDLRIAHSTEGGRGRLELVITGSDAAASLADALEALGYHVLRPDINFAT